MVELIKETKDAVLERLDKAINEKGADRMNIQEVGMLTDAVKDLAEAEKSCWEAEYYMTVTEAMEEGSMGYEDGMGYGDGMGYSGGSQGGRGGSQGGQGGSRGYGYRRGYRGQPRDSMGRYASRGYSRGRYGHDDIMQSVKDMMMSADPQEKEQMKQKLRQMADM